MTSDTILSDILNHVLEVQGIDLTYNIKPNKLKFPDGFRWRYYGKLKLQRGVKAYCYSTTKNANEKFISWEYAPIIGKKRWDYRNIREHVKRKDAKARAYKLSVA